MISFSFQSLFKAQKSSRVDLMLDCKLELVCKYKFWWDKMEWILKKYLYNFQAKNKIGSNKLHLALLTTNMELTKVSSALDKLHHALILH